jgi:hypothetical protein
VWQATEKNFGIINKPSKSMGHIFATGAVQKRSTFGQTRKFENTRPQQTDRYQIKGKESYALSKAQMVKPMRKC